MDAAIKIGECVVVQSCLVLVFIVLASLASVKFGLIFRVAKPIFGFLIGMSVGAYLVSLISYDNAWIGAIPGAVLGMIAAFAIGSGSEKI